MTAKEWTIASARQWALAELSQQPDNGVDVQELLCHVLNCAPSYLLTWPERMLTARQWQDFSELVSERINGHPLAYLTGHRGFWSLDLEVSAETLIPRPETELMVELALDLPLAKNASVLDLGTGTGAIALALASEEFEWQVTAVDFKPEIIELANRNKQRNQIQNAKFIQSSWFANLTEQTFQLIVSNPPYVENHSPWLEQGDVRFEPLSALTSGDDGLDDIRHIIQQTPLHLESQGWLMLEHGFEQAEAIQALLAQRGFVNVATTQDLAGLDRITSGQWPG